MQCSVYNLMIAPDKLFLTVYWTSDCLSSYNNMGEGGGRSRLPERKRVHCRFEYKTGGFTVHKG